jgi:hypothetical protein
MAHSRGVARASDLIDDDVRGGGSFGEAPLILQSAAKFGIWCIDAAGTPVAAAPAANDYR